MKHLLCEAFDGLCHRTAEVWLEYLAADGSTRGTLRCQVHAVSFRQREQVIAWRRA